MDDPKKHCGYAECPVMTYLGWLLTNMEGRLTYLVKRCLEDDFSKTPESQRTHCETVQRYLQHLQDSAGRVCEWLQTSERHKNCDELRQELCLSIEDFRDKLLLPLRETGLSVAEAATHIDAACEDAKELCGRFARLKSLLAKNQQDFVACTCR